MVLLILYVIGGFIVAAMNAPSLVVYLTILPIQYFLMRESWKTNNLVLSLLFTYFFVSMGLGTLMLYLDRESISNIGTNHVGNFDFSYTYLFTIYSYFLVFELIILYILKFLSRTRSLSCTIEFIKKETTSIVSKGKSYSLFPVVFFSILFGFISIWMYNNHIGLIGLKQVELPYHLAGILYYVRRFVFTIILIWLFAKTKDKKIAAIILILYALVVAVTGSSKSLNLMLLVPVGMICILKKEKTTGIVTIVSSLLIYTYVTCTREIVYAVDGEVSLMDVVNGANAIFMTVISNDMSYVTRLLSGVCESLYGMKNVVVAYQYDSLSISDFFSYYLGTHMGNIIPDMQYKLYGVTFAADKAYGVCVGFSGTMVMFGCRNYFLVVIEALIISIVLYFQNKAIDALFTNRTNKLYKYLTLLLLLFSMMSLIEANTLSIVYICTIFMIVLKRVAPKNKNYKIEYNAQITTN